MGSTRSCSTWLPTHLALAAMLAAGLALTGCKTTKSEDFETVEPVQEETLVIASEDVVEPAFTEDPDAFVVDPITGINEPAYGDDATGAVRRIALLLPLSGTHSGLGHDLLDAATLALFDIDNANIELVVADTKGTAEGAAQAANQVLAAQPDLIVGPLFSHAVTAAAPVAQQAGINIIALSSDLEVAQPGVFVLGIAPEDQIERVVAYAANQGRLRFAALAPQSRFGQRMVQAMEAAVARHGGVVVTRAFYNPDGLALDETVRELTQYPVRQADLENQIAELRARGDEVSMATVARLEGDAGAMAFDVLLIPDSGSRLSQLSAYLGYYDVMSPNVRLLGLASWNDPVLAREQVMQGAWFATAPDNNRSWFGNHFAGAYNTESSRLATLAYDAMALAAALTSSGAGGDFSERAITDWRGFQGVDGLFRFRDDGTPERGLVVMEITAEGLDVANPAPTVFEPPAVSMLMVE